MLVVIDGIGNPCYHGVKPTHKRKSKMTDQDIIDYFDSHFDATISEIAQMSGRSVAYVKRLLMGG